MTTQSINELTAAAQAAAFAVANAVISHPRPIDPQKLNLRHFFWSTDSQSKDENTDRLMTIFSYLRARRGKNATFFNLEEDINSTYKLIEFILKHDELTPDLAFTVYIKELGD